ncbi:hypothetical protein BASA50_007565 [Batrachochytrium salamandrivorans]|uniref:ELYS-like domain-containing protein n=1 Tax=Batrachochytrium salamandrivorans TaxID=1357716 RepID=A0ABQ8F757_9FUNG|nr:hypothetical protein BASA50_007565 [Batrachochytrium salamandrivorans]KAH9277436.1 hypothetical protein BASA83_000310 [Batrachochytrium salamandrivorans]
MQDCIDLLPVPEALKFRTNDAGLPDKFTAAFYVSAPVIRGNRAFRNPLLTLPSKSWTSKTSKSRTPTLSKAVNGYSAVTAPVGGDLNCQQSISASSAWFVRYGPKCLQVSTVVGGRHTLFALLMADQLADEMCENPDISLVTHIRLGLLEFLLIAAVDRRSKDTTLWLFEPFSLHTLKLPFEFDSSHPLTALGSSNAEIVDGQCCSYLAIGSVSKFFVTSIVPMCPQGVHVDTFQNLLDAHLSTPHLASVTAISACSSSVHDAPLFIIGTSIGAVEIWALKAESVLELVHKIDSECPSPITHIRLDFSEMGLQRNYILFVSNQLTDATVNGDHPLMSIYRIDHSFNSTKSIALNSLISDASVTAIKLGRDGNGYKLFSALFEATSSGDYFVHLQVQKLTGNSAELIASESFRAGPDEAIMDIEPFGSTSNCMVLFLNKVAKFVGDHNPPGERKIDYPRYNDWLSRDPNQFPYTPEISRSIQSSRLAMDGELFVDKLLSLFGISGSAVYPPSNPNDLESLFEEVLSSTAMDLLPKHCVIYYLLLDYGNISSEYARMWGISDPFLTSIRGYWEMDHDRFQIGALLLSDPSIELDWVSKVLKTLVKQKEYQSAYNFLERASPSAWLPADIEMHMEVLLHTHFDEALSFQRKNSAIFPRQTLFENLVHHAFSNSETPKCLKYLTSALLLPMEEACLISMCRSGKTVLHHDFLIAYFLNRSRYGEAIQLYDEIFGNRVNLHDAKSAARCSMIENIRLVVPQVQLASFSMGRESSSRMPQLLAESNKPLSLVVSFAETIQPSSQPHIGASNLSDTDAAIPKLLKTPLANATSSPSTPSRLRADASRSSPSQNVLLRALHDNYVRSSELSTLELPMETDTTQPLSGLVGNIIEDSELVASKNTGTPRSSSSSPKRSLIPVKDDHVFSVPKSIKRMTPVSSQKAASTPPPFMQPPFLSRPASVDRISLPLAPLNLPCKPSPSLRHILPIANLDISGNSPVTTHSPLIATAIHSPSFLRNSPALSVGEIRTPVQMEDRSGFSGMRPAHIISSPKISPSMHSGGPRLTNSSPFSQTNATPPVRMHTQSPRVSGPTQADGVQTLSASTPMSAHRALRRPISLDQSQGMSQPRYGGIDSEMEATSTPGRFQAEVREGSTRKSTRKQTGKSQTPLVDDAMDPPSTRSLRRTQARLQRSSSLYLHEDEENLPEVPTMMDTNPMVEPVRRTPRRRVAQSADDRAQLMRPSLLRQQQSAIVATSFDMDKKEDLVSSSGRSMSYRGVDSVEHADTPSGKQNERQPTKKTGQSMRMLRAPPKQLRSDIMMSANIPAVPDSISGSARSKRSTNPIRSTPAALQEDDQSALIAKRRQTPRRSKASAATTLMDEDSYIIPTTTPQRTIVTRRMARDTDI